MRPCTRWKVEPTVCAMACTMPSIAEPNAMPAMVAALCIFSRAFGAAAPCVTESSMCSKTILIACRHNPSVKSFA
ncbi:Uncharacterised protein [Mycobacteroides abscessus]|nr:Uncharacterised protein [Mycobacteroides abscessus]